jgi:putative transposase
MKRSKFSEEHIASALRQADSGTPVSEICRQIGTTEAIFNIWKKKYAHLSVTELRRRCQLGDKTQGEAS